jgi:hypothetical protein
MNRLNRVTVAVAVVLAFSMVPFAASAEGMGIGIGGRIDLVFDGNYAPDGGGDYDTNFGAGFGLVADYKVWDYIKVGLDITYYTLKLKGANSRDGLFTMGPRVIGMYEIHNVGPLSALVPYGFLTMGYAYFDGGDGESGFWIVGGGGCEAQFGSFGVFLEMSYGGAIGEDGTITGFGMATGGKFYF